MGKKGNRNPISLKEFMKEYSTLPYNRVAPIYINGIKTCYEVRDNGCIMSYRKGNGQGYLDEPKSLVGGYDSDGFRTVTLRLDKKQYTYRVHKLVASAFIPNLYNYPDIIHKNGNKLDNRVENLEWSDTRSDNTTEDDKAINLANKMLEINYFTIPEIELLTGVSKDKMNVSNYIEHESYLKDDNPDKLTKLAIFKICGLLMQDEYSFPDIAKLFNTSTATVSRIYTKKKHNKIARYFDFPEKRKHKNVF